jgi:hypothetical protein
MTDVYHELLDALSEMPGLIQSLVDRGIGDLPSGTNEEWGPAAIIAHLADSDRLYRERMQLILNRETPYLKPNNPTALAQEHDYASREFRPALEEFANERGEIISLLMNLALKQWDRTGIHDTMGEVSIEDLAGRLVDHDAAHLEQLEGMLAS